MNKNQNNESLNEEKLEKINGGLKTDESIILNGMHCLKAYGGPGYFNKITVKYDDPGHFDEKSDKCKELFNEKENNETDDITSLE